MGYLAKKVAERVNFLDSAPPPANAICSHFGDGLTVGSLRVGLGCKNRDEGNLLITIYTRKVTVPGHCRYGHGDPGSLHVGYSRTVHHARANSVADELGSEIIDLWNGEDFNNGISIVLARMCPAIVLTGIRNYGRLANPFTLSDRDRAGFDAYASALSQ